MQMPRVATSTVSENGERSRAALSSTQGLREEARVHLVKRDVWAKDTCLWTAIGAQYPSLTIKKNGELSWEKDVEERCSFEFSAT